VLQTISDPSHIVTNHNTENGFSVTTSLFVIIITK